MPSESLKHWHFENCGRSEFVVFHLPTKHWPRNPASKAVPKKNRVKYWVSEHSGLTSPRKWAIFSAKVRMRTSRFLSKTVSKRPQNWETHSKSWRIPSRTADKTSSIPSGSSYPVASRRMSSKALFQASLARYGDIACVFLFEGSARCWKLLPPSCEVTFTLQLLYKISSILRSSEAHFQGESVCFSSWHTYGLSW